MKCSKAITIVREVYDWVESALWATTIAFVIYFLSNVPEIARRAESIRTMNNAAENSAYCEKWGMKRGDHKHMLCMMDIQELRKKIEQDFADQGRFL